MKRTLILSITLSIVWQLGALAHSSATKTDSKAEAARARAAELISKAREAIGGNEKLKTLQGLHASGTYRRVLGDREMSGDVEYEILLPDRIRRTETMSPMPGMEMTRIDVLNGTQIWSDSQSSGGGGGMVMIRRPGAENPQAQTAYENSVRADFARQILGLLLTTIPSIPLNFVYAGEAESPDGKAEVIEVSGPDNLAARLFLDQRSHRPLMIGYKGILPRVVMRTIDGPPGGKEDAAKRAKDLEADEINAPAPPTVEMQISYEDYRSVGGIELPHRITRSSDGKVTEEVELKKFKLNPALKPSSFEKK